MTIEKMLQEKFKETKILLASKSPRRQELLQGLNLNFEIVSINSDESFPEILKREQITEYISKNKANAYTHLNSNELLITADTLVWLDGKIMGKPADKSKAFEMIQSMSGKTHEVFTSVTLKSESKIRTFSDVTEVEFDEISPEEINFYIDNYKPFDKAGAYGIQEWIGYAKIKGIRGCYYNVMGLPLPKLYQELLDF